MYFNSLSKIVLLSTTLALQARAGHAFPHITKGDLEIVQGNTAALDPLLATAAGIPTTGPFVPTAVDTGPDTTDFCGIFSGYWVEGVIDSSVLGTYAARWTIEYGQSTQPDAPVDPTSGCGPDLFNMTTVEFTRNWEVVAA
ncbi:hypothetical protein C8R45DRAFT_933898 [Mycena sanguinolenta]|nr:hypothetical protein C8R45DRAFT_933898 [Mycena sanguinolenta]